MRWFLAGVAFAAVVALAVGTASVAAANVRERAALRRLEERLEAAQVTLFAENARFKEASTLASLVERWRRLTERIERRGGS